MTMWTFLMMMLVGKVNKYLHNLSELLKKQSWILENPLYSSNKENWEEFARQQMHRNEIEETPQSSPKRGKNNNHKINNDRKRKKKSDRW